MSWTESENVSIGHDFSHSGSQSVSIRYGFCWAGDPCPRSDAKGSRWDATIFDAGYTPAMDLKSREVVLKLGDELTKLVEAIHDSLLAGLEQDQAKRLAQARYAAKTLASEGVPEQMMDVRRLEVGLVAGLEALGTLDVSPELGIKLSAAWALYREDMKRRKLMAMGSSSHTIEDEINAPGDDSVN